jgi:hypothetical protein
MGRMAKLSARAPMVLAGLAVAGLVAGSGCGGGSTGAANPDGGAATPLYAISTFIFNDNGATSYAAFVDTLDAQTIDLSSAAEFRGWSSIAASKGALFVGSGEAPEITRYEVTAAGSLQSPRTLSFANFGLGSVSLSHNTFVNEATAHLRLEETSRIVWNHPDLVISGSVDAPQIARERDGLSVSAANFEGIAVRPDGVFWPYFWHDADWYQFHQSSQIAVYGKDGTVAKQIDVPCPALNIATGDEDGNLYFTGMVDTVGYQLLQPGATLQRCAVRVDAGKQEIAAGWPRRFEELTGGRPAGRFYYLKDDIGVLTVFHQERATLDPADVSSVFDDHWGLWLVNLSTWHATPIEAWGFGSSNVFFSRVDGRSFIHRVSADAAETVLHEIGTDGSVTPRITVPGYAPLLIKIR